MLSMLKRHEIQILAGAGHSHDAVAEFAGVSSRTVDRVVKEPPVVEVDDAKERRRRRVGRPSKVEAFRKGWRSAMADLAG